MHKCSPKERDYSKIEGHFVRIANIGVAIGCFTRMLAYSEILGPAKQSPGPDILSDDGAFMIVYVILWGIAGVLSLFDAFKSRLGYGITMFIPLLVWWAYSYGLAWAMSHFQSYDWMTLGIYIASAVTISGLFGSYLTVRFKNRYWVNKNSELKETLRQKERDD